MYKLDYKMVITIFHQKLLKLYNTLAFRITKNSVLPGKRKVIPNDINMRQIVDLMENGEPGLLMKCVGMIVDELPTKFSSQFIKSIGV